MDVSSGFDRGLNFPKGIYIPSDDQTYLSSYRNGPKPSNFTFSVVSIKIIVIKFLCVVE
jgi:hypothetical protein